MKTPIKVTEEDLLEALARDWRGNRRKRGTPIKRSASYWRVGVRGASVAVLADAVRGVWLVYWKEGRPKWIYLSHRNIGRAKKQATAIAKKLKAVLDAKQAAAAAAKIAAILPKRVLPPRSHCPQGHAMTLDNLVFVKDKRAVTGVSLLCKTCRLVRKVRWQRKWGIPERKTNL